MKKTVNLSSILGFLSIATMFLIACSSDDVESTPSSGDTGGVTHEFIIQQDLGRVLFYDKKLSVNNAVSCGSCHKQNIAFADDVPLSRGFNGQLTTRNSMPIQNLGNFFGPFGMQGIEHVLFWDGRESNLEEMVLRPLASHIEMGVISMDHLVEKMKDISYYPVLFEKKFGSRDITNERIGHALAEFISRMSSRTSKFDMGEQMTAREQMGRFLFETKYPCNDCHIVQSPVGYLGGGVDNTAFTNIGLDIQSNDIGLGAVTGLRKDDGKFKVPSLRNVALTGPYMHDGRFETLEEVINHYSTGMLAHPNLDDRLRDANGDAMVMNISEEETKAIVAFLHTFTDHHFISDPSLSDPFK